MSTNRAISGQEAFVALQNIYNLHHTPTTTSEPGPSSIPPTPPTRLITPSPNTVLYLAYGSNLSAETFLGLRGIKPVSSTNVHVPTLTLTFDLAGIPYKEPCFANSAWRVPPIPDFPHPPWTSNYEDNDYHKDRWDKGLVGVVYEIKREDYATIISTEGGGTSYEDVIVPCFVLPKGQRTVDAIPRSRPFMAHTLLCPTLPSEVTTTGWRALQPDPSYAQASEVTTTGWRVLRPDPSYAQASARYLKLITDGAAEHQLPDDYTRYLHGIRSYTITTKRQEIGAAIFTGIWFSIIMVLVGLGKMLADDKGILPTWFATVTGFVFKLIWVTYDVFFKKVFGDGERTMEEDDGGDDEEKGRYILDEKTALLRGEGE